MSEETTIEMENIIVDNDDEFQAEYLTKHIMMRINVTPDPAIEDRKLMSIILLGRDYPSLEGHRINDNDFRFNINIPPVYEGHLSKFAENIIAFEKDWEYLKTEIVTPLNKRFNIPIH